MTTATSTEQSTESSCAFLNKPPFLFRKVLDKEAVRIDRAKIIRQAGVRGIHGAIAIVLNRLDLDLQLGRSQYVLHV